MLTLVANALSLTFTNGGQLLCTRVNLVSLSSEASMQRVISRIFECACNFARIVAVIFALYVA
jgi:hypothetical protein